MLPIQNRVVQLASAGNLSAFQRRAVDLHVLLTDRRYCLPSYKLPGSIDIHHQFAASIKCRRTLPGAHVALPDEHVPVQFRQLRPSQARLEVQAVNVLAYDIMNVIAVGQCHNGHVGESRFGIVKRDVNLRFQSLFLQCPDTFRTSAAPKHNKNYESHSQIKYECFERPEIGDSSQGADSCTGVKYNMFGLTNPLC